MSNFPSPREVLSQQASNIYSQCLAFGIRSNPQPPVTFSISSEDLLSQLWNQSGKPASS